MKIRLEFAFLIFFIGILAFLSPNFVLSATVSDNATVDVTISAVTEITLNTSTLSWGAATPGSNTSSIEVTVTNTGSTQVNNIYSHVDTIDVESSNPWDSSGTASGWSAATFLDVGNGTVASDPSYYYVGHVEWNKSDDTDASGYTLNSSGTGWKLSYGRLWLDGTDASDFYYWQLVNGSDGTCKSADTVFKVQQTRDSKNVDGGTEADAEAQSGDWATWTLASGVGSEYCIATYTDCTKFVLHRYDYNTTFPTCSNREYIIDGGPMSPSDYITLSLRARVEAGHIEGAASTGNLRIYASSVA